MVNPVRRRESVSESLVRTHNILVTEQEHITSFYREFLQIHPQSYFRIWDRIADSDALQAETDFVLDEFLQFCRKQLDGQAIDAQRFREMVEAMIGARVICFDLEERRVRRRKDLLHLPLPLSLPLTLTLTSTPGTGAGTGTGTGTHSSSDSASGYSGPGLPTQGSDHGMMQAPISIDVSQGISRTIPTVDQAQNTTAASPELIQAIYRYLESRRSTPRMFDLTQSPQLQSLSDAADLPVLRYVSPHRPRRQWKEGLRAQPVTRDPHERMSDRIHGRALPKAPSILAQHLPPRVLGKRRLPGYIRTYEPDVVREIKAVWEQKKAPNKAGAGAGIALSGVQAESRYGKRFEKERMSATDLGILRDKISQSLTLSIDNDAIRRIKRLVLSRRHHCQQQQKQKQQLDPRTSTGWDDSQPMSTYSFLGSVVGADPTTAENANLFMDLHALPSCFLICGQGHLENTKALSVITENYTIPNRSVSSQTREDCFTTVVLRRKPWDPQTFHPCELAWMCKSNNYPPDESGQGHGPVCVPKVRVVTIGRSHVLGGWDLSLSQIYQQVDYDPSQPSSIQTIPLRFYSREIDVDAVATFLTLPPTHESSESFSQDFVQLGVQSLLQEFITYNTNPEPNTLFNLPEWKQIRYSQSTGRAIIDTFQLTRWIESAYLPVSKPPMSEDFPYIWPWEASEETRPLLHYILERTKELQRYFPISIPLDEDPFKFEPGLLTIFDLSCLETTPEQVFLFFHLILQNVQDPRIGNSPTERRLLILENLEDILPPETQFSLSSAKADPSRLLHTTLFNILSLSSHHGIRVLLTTTNPASLPDYIFPQLTHTIISRNPSPVLHQHISQATFESLFTSFSQLPPNPNFFALLTHNSAPASTFRSQTLTGAPFIIFHTRPHMTFSHSGWEEWKTLPVERRRGPKNTWVAEDYLVDDELDVEWEQEHDYGESDDEDFQGDSGALGEGYEVPKEQNTASGANDGWGTHEEHGQFAAFPGWN